MSKRNGNLEIRHTFRAETELSELFEGYLKLGGYNKSAVIRNLLQSWIDQQRELNQGAR
ncbi:hypothetical protein SynSYN20_00817 [Synechococcus sp. SYN20]|nr:hypothetical protein SynSYN20_00817 [Synechococcus sp. SYN20]